MGAARRLGLRALGRRRPATAGLLAIALGLCLLFVSRAAPGPPAGPERGAPEPGGSASPSAPGALPRPLVPARAERARTPTPRAASRPEASAAGIARRAARLELRVVDAADRAPLPHARVELARSDDGSVRPARTDASGELAVALEPGAWRALAWSDALCGPAVTLALEPGAVLSAELALAPGVAVEGRVLDARTGRGIAGARVSFWTHAETDFATTEADGRFVHPRFPAADSGHQVRVEADGYAPLVRWLERDGAGWAHRAAHALERDARSARPRVEVALLPAAWIEGRVLDPAGRPVAGARVEAQGYARLLPEVATRDAAETRTDAAGRFRLDGLRPDVTHALAVAADGWAELAREVPAAAGPGAAPGERAAEAAGEGEGDLLEQGGVALGDLVLEPPALLAGVALDLSGAPVADLALLVRRLDLAPPRPTSPADPGARPEAGRRMLRTDAAGLFLCEGLAAGSYEIVARRDRGPLGRLALELRRGEERADLRLVLDAPTLALEGLVVGPDGPAAGASVAVERFGPVARVDCDAQGRFAVAGLDGDASYALTARAPGMESAVTQAFAYDRPRLELRPVEDR